jgi:cytoskeletal protein RodZ
MTREQEPISALVAILIAVAALIIFVFIVVSNRLQALQDEITASNAAPVDVSGWQTYENSQYGFEIEYPPQWQVSTDGLTSQTPFVSFGNPLGGPKTYDLDVFIEGNPNSLSSGSYAHAVLDAARAQDTANASSGPAPTTAPQFTKSYVLTIGGYTAYEFYNVFEFDHNAEQIYVAHGEEALRFDFPVAQENANLSLPVANNAIAHQILNTLVFTN